MSTKNNPAIGIYGGTFDPIHFGHLRPALEVCEKLNLDHIRFIPSSTPPHRDSPMCNTDERLLMLKTAIADERKFILDLREIKRHGPSYMVDTLISLKSEFSHHSLCLILGLDAFIQIKTWHRWHELLSLCNIIVTRRPETDFEDISCWPKEVKNIYLEHKISNPEDLFVYQNNKIFFMEVTQFPISSSLIRNKLKNKQSIRYLLPNKVYDIIMQNQLY